MARKKLAQKAFQQGDKLSLRKRRYLEVVKRFTEEELECDLGEADITSAALFGDLKKEAAATVKGNESGIVAGLDEVSWFYKRCGLEVRLLKKDGDPIRKGERLIEIKGGEKKLLETERTGLNLLQRMSGIATETSRLVKKTGGRLLILPTRKTHWGALDKKAVYIGGGGTHRLGLWDAILIKDNHLEALKGMGYEDVVSEAIDGAWKAKKGRFIEIEVESKEDVICAAQKFKERKGLYAIMLDNMSPKEMRAAVDELQKRELYDHILLEASGGITPENIEEYVGLGLDAVSLGYLTHSPKALDLSQDIILTT